MKTAHPGRVRALVFTMECGSFNDVYAWVPVSTMIGINVTQACLEKTGAHISAFVLLHSVSHESTHMWPLVETYDKRLPL